ncbi:hypothetical protein [Chitinimonas lacunae]|uniref:Uncharacterized protein n=1 Tax=Chitinimonas lacunae TaxID=1963018 RepID=A0ABV8MUT3_9NEIS
MTMTPTHQTIETDFTRDQIGDCFRAVVASLLELPIDEVPHCLHDYPDRTTWLHRVNEWLRPYNLGFIDFGPGFDLKQFGIAGLHHELRLSLGGGTYHSTVGVDGMLVHDPSTRPSSSTSQSHQTGVFIVLDPSKPIGKHAMPVVSLDELERSKAEWAAAGALTRYRMREPSPPQSHPNIWAMADRPSNAWLPEWVESYIKAVVEQQRSMQPQNSTATS